MGYIPIPCVTVNTLLNFDVNALGNGVFRLPNIDTYNKKAFQEDAYRPRLNEAEQRASIHETNC